MSFNPLFPHFLGNCIRKLERRQYKNHLTKPMNRLILKLPCFSLAYTVRKKCCNVKTRRFLGSVESFQFLFLMCCMCFIIIFFQNFQKIVDECCVCKQPIKGDCIESGKKTYHPGCMKCFVCGDTLRGQYFTYEGEPICERDYKV